MAGIGDAAISILKFPFKVGAAAIKAPFKIGAAGIVAGGKMAYGAGKFVATDVVPKVGEATGSAVMGIGSAVGKGSVGLAMKTGELISAPFNTPEKREKFLKKTGTWLKNAGNNMISKNDKGNYTLSLLGIGLVGTAMTYSKLDDSFRESKGEGMGTVDKYVTRPTPDYRPKEYERHPPKRIEYDSGGATGDLVFALHRLR